VENKLAELWSIFDFACPGFLGTLKDFNSTFAAPIERDRDAGVLASLRKITAPFLLRRLKSDPAIAADLPAKVTRDVPASLTAAQATLYQSVLDSHAADLEKSRGAVLSLITALKQVCNHPHVYDSAAHAPTLELSGKARLLVDLVAPILAAGEKVLVFSQYVSTVKLLASLLKQHLFVTPDVLTGELSVSEKDAVVTRFQARDACCCCTTAAQLCSRARVTHRATRQAASSSCRSRRAAWGSTSPQRAT
jgi:SNF2 family DNA or RNA helicase